MIKSFSRKQAWLSLISLILTVIIPLGGYLLSMTALEEGLQSLLQTVAGLALVLALMRLFCSYILRVQMRDCYITKPSFSGIWFIVGVGLAIIVFGSLQFFDVATDFSRVEMADTMSYIVNIFYYCVVLVLIEEMLFRGVILKAFSRWGVPVGVLVSSVLCVCWRYALLVVNGLQPLSASLIEYVLFVGGGLVASVMHCCITIEGESIWNSGLVHFLWNACFYGLIGVSSSSTANRYIVLTIQRDSTLLTGGIFGMDYSLVSITAFVVVTLIAIIFIKLNKRLQSMDE